MKQATLIADDDDDDGHKPPRPANTVNVTIPGERGNGKQGWVQTDKLAHDAMWKVGRMNSTALPLLHYMVAHIRRGSGGVVISANTLAADLGVTPRTIQNAVALLKKCNFIQVLKSGNTNVYIINSQVAWQGKRGGRYAAFNAAIKVHESEQDDTVENLMAEAENLIPVPQMSFLGNIDPDVIEMEDGVPHLRVNGAGEDGEEPTDVTPPRKRRARKTKPDAE
jgi:DNA-binding transcriptional regulator YhcF (GntR family)